MAWAGRGFPAYIAKLLIVAALSGFGAAASADPDADGPDGSEQSAREAVYGIWASSGTMIEVSPDETGGLSARIIALKNPLWREKDGIGVVGEPKTDLHNPDPALRDRPFIGLEMLSGYEYRRGRWRGSLYLPANGSRWRSTAWVKDGELRIRGHIGVSLLGRTQVFAPLSACNENILRMIGNAGMTGTPCDELMADAK